MGTERWGTMLIATGFALWVGGYGIYLLTDRSFRVLGLLGFVLAISGSAMRRRDARASSLRDPSSVPPNPAPPRG